MDIWITFFGVVMAGGAVLFLFLRRDRPRGIEKQHSLDEGPKAGRR